MEGGGGGQIVSPSAAIISAFIHNFDIYIDGKY